VGDKPGQSPSQATGSQIRARELPVSESGNAPPPPPPTRFKVGGVGLKMVKVDGFM